MIIYQVGNLEALVEELTKEDVTIVDEIEPFDYGKFIHIPYGEGNKVQLWKNYRKSFRFLSKEMSMSYEVKTDS